MRDIEFIFLVLTLFNTNLGITNYDKNTSQQDKMDTILKELKDIRKQIEQSD